MHCSRSAKVRLGLVAAALSLATLLSAAAAHAQANAPARTQDLVGKILVAAPDMSDPRFRDTVIYIGRHDAQGAFGLVVNKPQGIGPLEQVLRAFRLRAEPTGARVTVYWGGPVEPGRGFVLHSTDYGTNGALMVAGDLAVSRVEAIAVAIAEGRGPRATLMTFGYTSWGAGQLDREVQNGGWVVVAQDHGLVFAEPDGTKWKRAYSGFGLDL